MEYIEVMDVIITIIVAAVSGYISSKIAYNKEIKKKIYEEREKTYIVLFELVEKLKKDSFLVYNSKNFLIPFREIKSRVNLYASQEVINIVTPLYEKIDAISEKYFELFDSVEAQKIKEGRMEYEDVTEWQFQQEEELYMEENVIDTKYVETVLDNLVSQIRKELKTSNKVVQFFS